MTKFYFIKDCDLKRIKNRILLMLLLCISHSILFAQNNREIDSLFSILKTAKEDTSKVNTQVAISVQLRNNNDYEQAKQYANSAITLADELHFEKGKANAYMCLGNVYSQTGNFQEGLNNYFVALKIYEQIGDYKRIAAIQFNIGMNFANQDNYPEALNSFQASLAMNIKTGNKTWQAENLGGIGNIYFEQGNYPMSLKNYYMSLKLFEELGDKAGALGTYYNIGLIYRFQNNFEDYLKSMLEAIKIGEEIGNKEMVAYSHLELGGAYTELKDYPESYRNIMLALDYFKTANDKRGIAYCYGELGMHYRGQKNYPEALRYYYLGLELQEELGDKKDIAGANINIGEALAYQAAFENDQVANQNRNEASKYYYKGLSIAKEIGSLDWIRNAYANLSELDSAQGNFALALEHYKLYTLYKDSILNEESEKQTAQLKIQYETEKKDKEIALLNSENEIKALRVKQQEAELLAASLESEKNQSEITLLNQSKEIQQLQLAQTQNDLKQKQTEAESKTNELALAKKDQQIKDQQLQKQKVLKNGFLIVAILIIAFAVVFISRIQLRKKLEKQEAVLQERRRISSDMHDDLGSGLSKIALLTQVMKQNVSDSKSKDELDKISESAQESLEKMSEIVWSLNPKNDKLENLISYIRKFAVEYFEPTSITCKVNMPDEIPTTEMKGEQRRNVFLSVKEALHNVQKHSNASLVELSFVKKDKHGEIIIHDNGKGIDDGQLNRFGNGLQNMKQRMQSAGGYFSIENKEGTTVRLGYQLT